MNNIEVYVDDTPVRFTADGEVFVSDAFNENPGRDDAGLLWKDLVRRNPELLALCHEIDDAEKRSVPVADSDGWDRIHEKLFDLLIEQMP